MDDPSASRSTAHATPRTLLADPDIRTFLMGRVVSEVGSRITREGLPVVAILAAGATSPDLGLLAMLSAVPGLLIGTSAGAFADRRTRKPILIAADLIRAGLLLTIPAAALLGRLTFLQIALVTVLTASGTVLFRVADRAYLPSLVGTPRLAPANTLLGVADGVGESLGPVLMGVLVQTLTSPLAIAVDAVSYLVSAVSLMRIRKPEAALVPSPLRYPSATQAALPPGGSKDPPARGSSAHRISSSWMPGLEGLRAISRHPVLGPLAAALATDALFGGFFEALYEIYVLHTLHLSPALLGLLVTGGGLGSLVGALLATRLSRRIPLGRLLLGSFLLSALISLLVPWAHGPWFEAASFLMGAQVGSDLLGTIFQIHTVTLEQSVTPAAYLGRVEGALATLTGGLGMLGAGIGGLLGHGIGLRDAFWISTAGDIFAALWLFAPRLRALRGHPDTPDAAHFGGAVHPGAAAPL